MINNIPDELETLFIINALIDFYETRSSYTFYIPKAKTSTFGVNTLTYDGAKMWNQMNFEFVFNESSVTYLKHLKHFKT